MVTFDLKINWKLSLGKKFVFLFEFKSLHLWQSWRYVCFVGRNSDTSGAEVTLLLPLVFRKKLGLQTLQQNEHAYRYKAPAQYPTGTPECVFTRPATVFLAMSSTYDSNQLGSDPSLVFILGQQALCLLSELL